MSIYIDDLRSMAQSGVPLCDLAADEIESIEEAYELLFKENAKLRQQQVTAPQAREKFTDEWLDNFWQLAECNYRDFGRGIVETMLSDRAIRPAAGRVCPECDGSGRIEKFDFTEQDAFIAATQEPSNGQG